MNELRKKVSAVNASKLGGTLAAIGCALLQGLPNQAQAGELEKWDFDAAVFISS